ncbi:DUF3305 domain-containing protein [Bradyrhizobium sp. 160]|uniref:DUF3305 domain-containing protein n=1 Tax=Bradyrhizobium sp. 160 TaxID=2782634 RepID=UPI001FFB82B9|nr:DUF3305 domain-containing protein [Bradyrhizobium sp. 160]MCK1626804.1 DUF3305 domain-containing protein [Bradyrhizobium sp. 160]
MESQYPGRASAPESGSCRVNGLPPLLRIPVGIVVERSKANSQWSEYIWGPIAVLGGIPDVDPWTQLGSAEETVTLYAGAAEMELYRTETENYRNNLASSSPSVWVALLSTAGAPPYEIAVVTADPAEGEALTEPGQGIVEAVPMPGSVRDAIASFVAEHHVERVFVKRKRNRPDPEALARPGPQPGSGDE